MPKYSKQREKVLEFVRSVHTHPTAYEVYEQVRKEIPNISLGTVYRNLSSLAEEGEIDILLLGDGTVRFDGNVKGHLHLTCKICGMIEDVAIEDGALPLLCKAHENGFSTERGVYVLYGICKNCQEQKNKEIILEE